MADGVIEQFLEEEAEKVVPGLDPLDRARFARLVRECASCWRRHNQSNLRVTRGRYGMSLQFEGPLGGKVVSIFALRAVHTEGEYRFVGPNADRKRLGLDPEAMEALERLRGLYEALLSARQGGETTVNAVLAGRNFPDLVPLVEETRRILDGGPEGGPLPPGSERRAAPRKRKPKEEQASHMKAATTDTPESLPEGHSAETPQTTPTPAAPVPSPEMAIVIELACEDPRASEGFYRKLLGVKPLPRTKKGDPFLFNFGAITVLLREDVSKDERKQFGYGTATRSRGWGTTLRFKVPNFKNVRGRAKRLREFLLEMDEVNEHILLRDPAGYVVRVDAASHTA